MGKQWHPWHVFQHEYKEAIDTKANRLCAKAIKAGEKRPKGGDPTHFDFWEQVVTEMMGNLRKGSWKSYSRQLRSTTRRDWTLNSSPSNSFF